MLSLFALLGCAAESNKAKETMVKPEDLQVHFIDVGQGDSILIQTPENKENILIDAGPKEAGNRVVSYLKDHGVDKIHLLIATHPHEDHIGGLLEVLEHFPVQQVIDSGKRHNSNTYKKYLRIIAAKKIPFSIAKIESINLSKGIEVRILGPIRHDYEDLNNYSVVTKLVYGKTSFLFTGDMEKEAERDIAKEDLQASILKVGHHGSRSSTSAQFLRRVKPEVAVISLGKDNDYGHPHEITLKKLSKVGVKVYRTDINGTIDIISNGSTYSVKTEK